MTFNTALLLTSTATEIHPSPGSPNPSQILICKVLGEINHRFNTSENLDQTLANLPGDERRHFDEAVPPTLWRELKSLSRESDLEILEDNLLSLADRIETRDNSELADSIYRVLSTYGSTDRIREVSEKKVLSRTGNGDFKDFTEYSLKRFAKQVFDPVNIATTLAGIGAFRAVRYGMGFKLAGKISALPGGYNALSTFLGWVAASSSATFAEKLTRSTLTNSWDDWSGQSLTRELAINALTYGLALGNAKSFSITKVKNGLASKIGMTFGAFGGAIISRNAAEKLGLSTRTGALPATDTFLDCAAFTAHFLLARGLSNVVGGRNFVVQETTMFGRGIFTPANF